MRGNLYLISALLLVASSICVDINLEDKPKVQVEEDQDIFSIISKQRVDEPELFAGRSGTPELELRDGDIMVNKSEKNVLENFGRSASEENLGVLLWPRKIWASRIVPYIISGQSYDAIRKIEAAMRDLEKKVCLKFKKWTTEKAYLYIYRGSSCWAGIGRSIGFGRTKVSLGPMCLSQSLIQHEIIHALGFYHEQSRRDRDNYVNILKYNVQSANLYNFDKAERGYSDTFGVPYDYLSIMHYSRTTWTKNGRNTMEAKGDPNRKLGGSVLSPYDIMKLNSMYHCHEKSGQRWTAWSDWSHCIENYKGCYRSKHRICLVDNLALCPGADEWGVQSSAQKCPSPQYCKVEPADGFWGSWAAWSRCTKSCDKGTRTRSRKCDAPKPANGGLPCKGTATDTERCMMKSCRNSKFFNNFNAGLGMWSNVKNYKDPLDWKRGRGRTSSYSGPSGDHTDGNGWYLYVPTVGAADHLKIATLVSEYMTGSKCISLAYCMNGKNMGSLDFFVQLTNGQYLIFPKKKKGHQGTGWHDVQFSLTGPLYKKFSYRFFIEAKTGYAPYSNIAIDDILIEDGACGSKTAPAGIGSSNKKPDIPGAVVTEGCQNKNKNCISWSRTGECAKNAGFMLEHCCLACRGMKQCKKDKYDTKKCSDWASKGECHKNSEWMWNDCCKSCKDQGTCSNTAASCDDWAKQGYCDREENKVWMWKNCCSACVVAPKCSGDKNNKCKEWAKKGECKKNPDWMQENCCKSCRESL